MSRPYDEIREEVLALPEEQRAALADDLHDSLLTEEERELEREWDRRAEELISGKVKGIPAEEAHESVRAALSAARRAASDR